MAERHASIHATSTVTAVMSVVKSLRIQVRGYSLAVRRLREAVAADDGNDVYIALFEATTWLISIADRESLKGDADVQAVIFARNRAHHHSASSIANAGAGWTWRAAAALPRPADARHDDAKKQTLYESRLQGKPVLEVFDRLAAKIAALSPDPV